MNKIVFSTNGSIGIDLDNTIVSYDEIIYQTALDAKLIKRKTPPGKKAVRDSIRQMMDGEIRWQQLQAEIYGPLMHEAKLIDGVVDFLLSCRHKSIPVYIISHKTEYANYDQTGTNLRLAALEWLKSRGFFDSNGIGLRQHQVFFESTRQEKINRIKRLCCLYFIDDLEETYLEKTFPADVGRILFDPRGEYDPRADLKICTSWSEISEYIFFNRRK